VDKSVLITVETYSKQIKSIHTELPPFPAERSEKGRGEVIGPISRIYGHPESTGDEGAVVLFLYYLVGEGERGEVTPRGFTRH